MVTSQETGRAAQRRRTRRAIVDAATRLLAGGGEPTVDQVAEAAEVSRRTVYLHFPTLDQLLLDATAGALAAESPVLSGNWPDGGAEERVTALAEAVLGQGGTSLPLGRQLIRLTVTSPPPDGGPRRGYRRMQWIAEALEPVRDELDDEQCQRLSAVLAVLVGFESMVVMRDVAGLDENAERRAVTWAARTLVAAIRAETGSGTSPTSSG